MRIYILTLCHHEKLAPHGLCRICTVEAEVRGWTRLVAACLYPVEQDLAQEYGADKDRFEKEASFCILCGLCVMYCAEVKEKNAVGFVDCGARREIRFIPEIAATECINCKECFALCPASYLRAAFVLTESFCTR